MDSSVAMQLELGDQIPYADGSCDGSVSSIGTGSILGHSTSEEDISNSRERLWKYQREQNSTQEDHHSLNNILDKVSSSHSKLAELEDDVSIDKLGQSTCSSGDIIKKKADDVDTVDGGTPTKVIRPTSLSLGKDIGRTSLASAYFSLSEQLNDSYGYESIYNNSCGYGVINGSLSSPTKSIQSSSSSQQPHHYISSYRAKASLSKRSGAKLAALSSASSSSTALDRAGQDPVCKLQALLKQRYQRLVDERAPLAWCDDFRPPLRNMVFGLARDASWEMGTASSGTPNLRRIPLHGLLAEDRRSERKTGKRILVVGDTGHGKSTLILRLAHDWSTQDPASGYLAHYRLVYLISCRDAGRSVLGTASKEEAEFAANLGTEFESQTLYLIDGLDELSNPWPEDVRDLIDGKACAASTVLATSRPVASASGYSSFHKRVVLHGLEPSHVDAFVTSYFSDPDSGMKRLLAAKPRLAKLAACPLMCALLCSTYREESCRLPESIADLYALLFRKVVGGSLKQEGHLTTHQRKMLLDFGKLALHGIKEDRYFYTDAEIKTACQSLEILRWGFLLKGVTASGKSAKRITYQTIHASWSEYAAALYLASVSHYANIIQREVYSLPLDAEPCLSTSTGIQRSCLQVLIFLCSILSKKAYLLFNILEPLDFPCATLLNFLHMAGRSNANVAAIGKLIHGHAVISTSSDDQLESWAALIDHPECLLHSLAIRYDGKVERKSLQSLVEVIGRNSTLNTVKLTAVIGQDLEGSDLNLVARHLALMMGKPKLQNLELAVSSMDDEMAVVDVIQPLVDALSNVIGGTLVSKLSLDVDLTAAQVDQLCKAMQTSSVRSLHIQHLSCAWSGLQAVTSLIGQGSNSSVTGLDLSGCWAPNNSQTNGLQVQETDAGMGTLSGSSTCSTGSPTPTPTTPIPSTPIPSTHSPRPKKSEQFLSLPRRPTRGSRSYSSLTRAGHQRTDASPGPFSSSGYLSRTDEKRRSDSMLFQKVLLPLPACDRSSHLNCGFHLIFDALRHPACRLTQLNLSKSSITVSDSMCLGESLRKNRTLVSLRLEGLSSLKEVLPVCLALAENKSLQLLDVSSNHVAVNDSAFQLICRALGRNGSLQSLRMCGWTFNLEEDDTFKSLTDAIQSSRLRELALSSSLVKLSFQDKRSPLSAALLGPVVLDDLVALMAKEVHEQVQSDWMAFMKLDNCRLELCNKLTLRGAHLVCFASGFQKLAELNLSLEPSSNAEPLRDKATLAFFQTLANSCGHLKTLVLQNWNLQWSKPDKVLKGITKSLKNMSLNSISMDGLKLNSDSANETALAVLFITSLTTLNSLSLNGWKLRGQDANDLGRTIRDKMAGSVLELSLKNVPSQTIRAIVRVTEESGRVTASRNGCMYRFKKSSRAPGFFNKMMLITSSWKD